MAERFFVPEIGESDLVRLTGDEAHHLARVRRIGRSEQVSLFDGSGTEFDAIVSEITKHEVQLSITNRRRVDRELPFSLTLACSPPKGDRFRWLVEKAVELGVSRFVPLLTERATEQAHGLKADRLRRWVIEASKQCGRNVLMQVTDGAPWTDFLKSACSGIHILAHPLGEPSAQRPRATPGTQMAIAVGPEGGFADRELREARERDWITVSLGPRILRIETAALAMVARVSLGEGI
jgi:16S rRNA (uracil1498-N3)-methyltransferase